MSDLDVKVELRSGNIVDKIEDAIVDGIENAADKNSQSGVASQAEEVAKARIRESGAIFTRDLIESFEIDYSRSPGSWHVKLENTSDHAAPIEYGAEYGDEGPPVAALIPWVAVKMHGFTVPDDDMDDVPSADRIRDKSGDVSYGPDVTELAPPDVVEKAFWLQQHIKENGLDALRYMKKAEVWANENAGNTVAGFISSELKDI